MFVSAAKYRKAVAEREIAELSAAMTQLELRRCKMFGKEFTRRLNNANAELQALRGRSSFSEEELKALLQLVHPDKHGGKESAVRMTQKINQLRGK